MLADTTKGGRPATSGRALTPPLKWHSPGGKSYLAKRIIALMPPRCKNPNAPAKDDPGWLHYVEPFFGGGAVLLQNDPAGISEVVNDLNTELANFWSVIRSPEWFDAFVRCVEGVPFSQEMFEGASHTFMEISEAYITRAVRFFIRARQSRQGLMKDFATLSRNRTRRGMNEQVSSWLGAIEGLADVHERLKRVVILNKPALEVIKQQDGPRTFFYLDPPYLHETRVTTGEYAHEMTSEDHGELLSALSIIEGRFILSGYPSKMYDDCARLNGWDRVDIAIDNKASSKATKDIKTECLWANYRMQT